MTIKTKFGTARIDSKGYYSICSHKEGNYSKRLHRLVFEDFYNITLPPEVIIHHDDGDKLNNEIWNLIPMSREEHQILHNTGRTCSDETIQKMRDGQLGITHDMETKIQMSDNKTTTGLFRVSKQIDSRYAKGYGWKYQYYNENGKRQSLMSTTLPALKEKVLSKGLEWIILDEEKAKATMEM